MQNDDANSEISALKQMTEILSFKSHFTRAVNVVWSTLFALCVSIHSFVRWLVCSFIEKVKHFMSYELS